MANISRERLHLPSALNLTQPSWAIFYPQLAPGLHLLQGVLAVKRTAENNVESTKRFCVCYFAQRTATVAAKGELNSHAVFVRCGGFFRGAGREFELVLGN
jgi:hypothetical protein